MVEDSEACLLENHCERLLEEQNLSILVLSSKTYKMKTKIKFQTISFNKKATKQPCIVMSETQ